MAKNPFSLDFLNEEAEFDPKDPQNPTKPIDKAGSFANISVPGGDKETPSAKPEGGYKEIPVPGGDKEAPAAHAVPGATIGTPGSSTLKDEEYNAALSALQKSFKEGAETIQLLRDRLNPTPTIEDLQLEFMEAAIQAALDDGPMYEYVDKADKKEVKAIVKIIRKPVINSLRNWGIIAKTPAEELWLMSGRGKSCMKEFNKKGWQSFCFVHTGKSAMEEALPKLNDKFANNLQNGKYIIDAVALPVSKMYQNSIGGEDSNVYLLFVDDANSINDFKKEVVSGFKAAAKDSVKKESVSYEDYEDFCEFLDAMEDPSESFVEAWNTFVDFNEFIEMTESYDDYDDYDEYDEGKYYTPYDKAKRSKKEYRKLLSSDEDFEQKCLNAQRAEDYRDGVKISKNLPVARSSFEGGRKNTGIGDSSDFGHRNKYKKIHGTEDGYVEPRSSDNPKYGDKERSLHKRAYRSYIDADREGKQVSDFDIERGRRKHGITESYEDFLAFQEFLAMQDE